MCFIQLKFKTASRCGMVISGSLNKNISTCSRLVSFAIRTWTISKREIVQLTYSFESIGVTSLPCRLRGLKFWTCPLNLPAFPCDLKCLQLIFYGSYRALLCCCAFERLFFRVWRIVFKNFQTRTSIPSFGFVPVPLACRTSLYPTVSRIFALSAAAYLQANASPSPLQVLFPSSDF